MKAKTVTPETAQAIAHVLYTVMSDLRALRDVADSSIASGDLTETVAALTIAICERTHVMVDECSIRLGGSEAGNYRVDDLFKAEAA
jgi:hypothetical protein